MFILHTPKSNKPTSILIKKKLQDGPFKASLGVSVHPAFWDKANERAIVENVDRSTLAENKSINALLGKIEDYIESRTRDARYTSNYLSKGELAAKIDELTGKKKAKADPEPASEKSFYDLCREIIDDMEDGIILTPQGKVYSAGTIKNYNQSLNSIEAYNADITFEAVDMTFYRSFIKWCNDKDWSMNYIAQHIKNLVCLMKATKKRGHHNNTAYLDEDFRVIQENTDDIALSEKELEKLYKHNVPDKTRDIARDWFIVGCFTGLRVSDIKLLTKINIASDTIVIANEKTDTKVVIPMRTEVREILKKWGGFPPKMTDQEINRSIKEVAETAGLTQTVLYFLTKGGTRRDFYLKKFEMISCHTMRRCFITLLLNAGAKDHEVMQLAGIKKHATLLRYKKTKPEETAEIMKGHPFFNGTPTQPTSTKPSGWQ
jgi:site-specific recombinase XerD